MKVTKAVIPAAGLGTRFLPSTKAVPKEMMTIVDKPTLHYIVEEAVHDIDHYKLVDTLPTGDNIQPGMIYVLREN